MPTRTPFGQRTLLTTTPDVPARVVPASHASSGGVVGALPTNLIRFASATASPGTIGIVTGELLRYAPFWRSVMSLERPPGSAVAQSAGLDLPTNRNRLVEHLHGDWLFALDDDLVLQPNTLMRLLAVLEREPYDIVAAYSLRRSPPFDSLVYLDDPIAPAGCPAWTPDDRRGVLEIAACGLGGVLIHKRVFKGLDAPYFRVGQVDPDHYQEDVEFCHRARAAGFRICVDLDTPVGHTTPMVVWPGRDPSGAHCVALVGVGGEVVPVDTTRLRASMVTAPSLIGL